MEKAQRNCEISQQFPLTSQWQKQIWATQMTQMFTWRPASMQAPRRCHSNPEVKGSRKGWKDQRHTVVTWIVKKNDYMDVKDIKVLETLKRKSATSEITKIQTGPQRTSERHLEWQDHEDPYWQLSLQHSRNGCRSSASERHGSKFWSHKSFVNCCTTSCNTVVQVLRCAPNLLVSKVLWFTHHHSSISPAIELGPGLFFNLFRCDFAVLPISSKKHSGMVTLILDTRNSSKHRKHDLPSKLLYLASSRSFAQIPELFPESWNGQTWKCESCFSESFTLFACGFSIRKAWFWPWLKFHKKCHRTLTLRVSHFPFESTFQLLQAPAMIKG